MRRVAIIAKLKQQPRYGKLVQQVAEWFTARGVEVVTPPFRQLIDGEQADQGLQADLSASELIITLGGDGTLLGTARFVAGSGTPILGVNAGHLGFLTDMESSDLLPSLERLLQGDYRTEERMMLETSVLRSGETAGHYLALNDVVVTKGTLSRIVALETYAGGEYLSTYRADGLIVATPTGSTAYSLSAGGPIAAPDLGVLVITPICPHTLYARPFIISDQLAVRMLLKSEGSQAMLTVDGQIALPLKQDDQIVTGKAAVSTNLVKLRQRSFYEVLRLKMRQNDH
jgi:NAD+ kinase